jgi:hypothetical protein
LEMACDHHKFQNFEAMCPKQTKTDIMMQIWLCTTLQWINSNPHTMSVLCQMCSRRHIYFKLTDFFYWSDFMPSDSLQRLSYLPTCS